MRILVINGPNINMLGIREPGIYGNRNYDSLKSFIRSEISALGADCELFQSNHEGEIVDIIQNALGKFDGIIINPAAYTHTSVAILDALKAVNLPAIEVHLSDPNQREDFRHISYAGIACIKTFAGYGFDGYKMAAKYLVDYLSSKQP